MKIIKIIKNIFKDKSGYSFRDKRTSTGEECVVRCMDDETFATLKTYNRVLSPQEIKGLYSLKFN